MKHLVFQYSQGRIYITQGPWYFLLFAEMEPVKKKSYTSKPIS